MVFREGSQIKETRDQREQSANPCHPLELHLFEISIIFPFDLKHKVTKHLKTQHQGTPDGEPSAGNSPADNQYAEFKRYAAVVVDQELMKAASHHSNRCLSSLLQLPVVLLKPLVQKQEPEQRPVIQTGNKV